MGLVLVGHPFDTIKARLQAKISPYTSVAHCVRSTWKREGLYGFYGGVSVPLTSAGFFNAYLFTLQLFARERLEAAGAKQILSDPVLEGVAGFCVSPFYVALLTPYTTVTVRLQTINKGMSVRQCVRETVRGEGVLGLWKGFVATVMLRPIGLPWYFGGYHTVCEYFQREGGTVSPPRPAVAMLGGAVGGTCYWTANYPMDVIKTRMQTSKTKVTVVEAIRSVYMTHGARGFYRGFSVCVARAAPANAVAFLGFEMSSAFFFETQKKEEN